MSRRLINAIESLETRTLFAAGDLDPSFGLGGVTSTPFGNSYALTRIDVANGRVVLGGTTDPEGNNDSVALAVLDSGGQLLKSFSGDGLETERLNIAGGVLDLLVQPDNKIVVLAGLDTGGPRVLARFNANGTLDTAFGQKSIGLTGAGDIARAPNGDIIVAGTSQGRLGAVRYGSNGAFKSQLSTNVTAGVFDVATQGDGKVVIVGYVPNADLEGGLHAAVFRAKADLSSLDTTFNGDGILDLPQEQLGDLMNAEVEIDAQGRIVVGLNNNYQDSSVFRVLGTNGTLDPSFAPSGFGGIFGDLSIAPDGKIHASGTLHATGYMLTRYNANGGIDQTFGSNGTVYNTEPYQETWTGPLHDVQPDGRLVTPVSFNEIYGLVASDSTPTGTAVLGTDRVLRVTGTEAGNDDIGIVDYRSSDDDGGVSVQINGQFYTFPSDGVDRIEVNALGGNDRVHLEGPFGGSSDDPTQRPRLINGGAGNDELHGAGGNDTLLGMDGNDRLFGNGGNDHLDGGTGTDIQLGGTGADTIDYSFRGSAVFVDLDGLADDGPSGERDTVGADVEHILGGRGNDTLTGNGLDNFIRGNGGNDTIRGGGGNDTLRGDAGQDKLYGEAGNDFLDARDGITDLVLDGGIGTDTAKKDNSDPRTSIELLV